jgi:hypothetical protein
MALKEKTRAGHGDMRLKMVRNRHALPLARKFTQFKRINYLFTALDFVLFINDHTKSNLRIFNCRLTRNKTT